MGVLERRDVWCTNGFSTYRCSKWHSWGRWALLALAITGVFFFFFFFAFASARRRRRQGLQPYMGTGWTTYRYNNNNQNNNQYPPQPPPAYTPAEGYYGPNPNYYGNPPPQQQGVELQPPQNAYRGDNYIYPPPSSPPPAHMPKQ